MLEDGHTPADPLEVQLPEQEARLLHAGQRRAWCLLLAAGLALAGLSLAGIFRVHQAFFWGLLVGGALTALGARQLLALPRGGATPRFSITLDDVRISAGWHGVRPRSIPWSDVTRIVEDASGFVVTGSGGGVIVVPRKLPQYEVLIQAARSRRAAAPRPPVVTRLTLEDPPPEPSPPGALATIGQIDRIRGALGISAVAAMALIPLGIFTSPVLTGLAASLAALLGGTWCALVFGLRAWLLGVFVVSNLVVFQTTYRGKWARRFALLSGAAGLMVAAMGGLGLVACLVTLAG